jgi:hypothetical protein
MSQKHHPSGEEKLLKKIWWWIWVLDLLSNETYTGVEAASSDLSKGNEALYISSFIVSMYLVGSMGGRWCLGTV